MPEPGNQLSPEVKREFAVQATDMVERYVGMARSKVVDPAQLAAKWLVYGLVAGMLGAMLAALLVALLVRVVDVYLPGHVWSAHLLIGSVFVVVGAMLWKRRAV